MSSSSKVVVVGSANMDLVFRAQVFPKDGETVSGISFDTFPGGKGANQAVSAGRMSNNCLFVGKVGSDAFGDELEQSLRSAGVDTSGLLRSKTTRTGVASIDVDNSAQNRIIVVPGANGELEAGEAILAANGFSDAAIALFQHETPEETVNACIKEASRHCRVILNPAPARRVDPSILPCLHLITPNETEAEVITGIPVQDESSCISAAKWFHDHGVQGVVITLGSRGCFYSDGGRTMVVAPPKVTPVDTTAAGDAFNGALAVWLAQGREIENALALANHVGAMSTTRHGAQASIPSLEELKAFAKGIY